MEENFNPAVHLRTLTKRRKVKDQRGNEQWVEETHLYLDVKYRILWFRHVYPEGYVETEELVVNENFARLEATVYDKDPLHGGKKLGKGRRQVWSCEFKDYIEKAETQAIGRALAVAGFGTQFCDELDEGDSVADAPVDCARGRNGTDYNAPYKIGAKKGLAKDEVDLIVQYKFQKNDTAQLTDSELEELVSGLQGSSKNQLHNFLTKLKTAQEANVA